MQLEIENIPLMIFVLETYIEGQKEAKEASVIDFNTLDTPEKLLETMATYDEDLATLQRALERLKDEART